MTASTPQEINNLINSFMTPPKGTSPQDIRDRILHWAEVYNHPELFTNGDSSPFAIAAKRKAARQSLRRLIQNHPEIAKAIQDPHNESSAGVK